MKRPKSDDRGRLFGRRHPSVDETLVDYGQPGTPGVGAQPVGRSVLQVSVSTDVGRVRRNNEDFVQAAPVVRDGRRYALWAVADGVGGGPQGERASRTAVETVVDYLTHELWTDTSAALTDAFALANRNVFEITGEGAAASTMVVALVTEPEGVVCIANVGDSRAYIIAGGEARQITDDHSIVAARVAAGQITAAEARTAADRNVLTRSVGSEREVLVNIFGPRQLQPNERLVLCTDGVHGMIDDAAIARLGGSQPIADAAAALVKAAVEAGGRDNATALVGGFEPAAASARPPATPIATGTHHRPPALAILSALGIVLAVSLATFVLIGPASPSPTGSATPSIRLTPTTASAANATASVPTTPPPVASSPAALSPKPPTLPPNTFSPTDPMVFARTGATATLLKEGLVLIAGGSDENGKAIGSAELFDPAKKTFSPTGSMKVARAGATATLLSNGKVLIAGGSDGSGPLDSAEIYDPAKKTFSPTGPMAFARADATATPISGDLVLIAGGSDGSGPLDSAEIYDPAKKTFSPTGPMAFARADATATPISGDLVLIAGGSDENGKAIGSAELFDPAKKTFSPTGSMKVARAGATATLLSNGKVLIAGGSDGSGPLDSAEIYDPAKKTFSPTGPMAFARADATATPISGDLVLIAGGSDENGKAIGSAELFDPAKKTFSPTGSMKVARAGATATLLSNGKVLIAGGSDGSGPLDSAELYTP